MQTIRGTEKIPCAHFISYSLHARLSSIAKLLEYIPINIDKVGAIRTVHGSNGSECANTEFFTLGRYVIGNTLQIELLNLNQIENEEIFCVEQF